MSIRSAIVLCRDKVSQSREASDPDMMLLYARESEFGLTILAEALEAEPGNVGRRTVNLSNIPEVALDPLLISEMDGVSIDDNPEDETKEERMEKERSRGFFG